MYNKDNTKVDMFGKVFEHTTNNCLDRFLGATVATKVGEDDLTLTARAGKLRNAAMESHNMVRGDFGFTHDDWFIGYRHEANLDGKN